MAQTGIPFGEVSFVREFLRLSGKVDKPVDEHPKRPVEGLACPRSEVSGRRLWGWIEARFGTAEAFFERFFVGNYCPLMFLEESGRNRTPDRLPAAERKRLTGICDDALRDLVAIQRPRLVVGVGRYASAQASRALEGRDVEVGCMLHPSPANPAANRGWEERAEADLERMAVRL
jgi:single-strand selective monofunctional uracil DNA glycosylase